MSLSIIIPVYNEELCISECIDKTFQIFKDTDYEIIVVNDGSNDNTHKIIKQKIENKKEIKYIYYETNKGYSNAIREGFKKATKKYVSFIDADLQYPPEELLKMYNYSEKNLIK